MPPRITRKSDRRKVSDRTMVGTAQLLCLPALGTDGRRSDSMMNLRKKKTHSVSFHDWGWTARPFSLRFAAAGEAFVLTSLFIERDYRQLEIWQIPHDNKTTWRVLHAAANAVAYAPGATGSFSESVFAD